MTKVGKKDVKIEDYDMEDVYDSLRYTYDKDGPEAVNGYLDVWYAKTEDENLKDKISELKKGGWFGNWDYQVTQPAYRLLCEKKTPYRGMKDICKLDNIMDKEAHEVPVQWQGTLILIFFTILLSIGIRTTIWSMSRAYQKRRKGKKSRRKI